MTRRELLAGAAVAATAGKLSAFKSHISKARISAITDEIGKTQAEAIEFAHHYGLSLVELRNVPETRKEISFLSEPELKSIAAELASNKLKVSFLNSSLMKFTWPGINPASGKKDPDQKKWDRRKEDAESAVRAAVILGCDKVRVFTGTRDVNPESTYPLIVRTVEELLPIFEKAKVKMLLENENSQNIGTSPELKAIFELIPSKSVGYNWDPGNAQSLKELPWPDGYKSLPVGRMMNIQFKAKNTLDSSPDKMDWKAVLEQLQKDNYQGALGLETHSSAPPGLIENANEAMKVMLHAVGQL